MRKLSAVLVCLLIATMFAGGAFAASPVKIVATDNGWDSQKLHNAIAELVVEHAYDGYEFELSTASSTMNWQSIIAGEVDLDIESWTDNVASYPTTWPAATSWMWASWSRTARRACTFPGM